MSAEIIKLKSSRQRAPLPILPGHERLRELYDELRRTEKAIAVLNYNRLCTLRAYHAELKRVVEREEGRPQRPGRWDQHHADKLAQKIADAAAKLPADDAHFVEAQP